MVYISYLDDTYVIAGSNLIVYFYSESINIGRELTGLLAPALIFGSIPE